MATLLDDINPVGTKNKPSTRWPGKLVNRKKLLYIVVILLVIVLGVVWFFNKGNQPTTENKTQIQTAYQQKVQELSALLNAQKFDQVITVSKEYMDTNPKKEFRYEVLSHQGTAYMGKGDFKSAETSLLAAASLKKPEEVDGSLLQALAFAYEGQGNKIMAAQYYKKYIERVKTTPEETDDLYISGYQEKIKRLESNQ